MTNGILNVEHIVEKIEKYNVEKDKANGKRKLWLLKLAFHASAFITASLFGGTESFSLENAQMVQIITFFGGVGSFIKVMAENAKQAGLEGRIDELKNIIQSLINNTTKAKGMGKQ